MARWKGTVSISLHDLLGSSPGETLFRRVVFLSGVLSRCGPGDASGELGMERPAECIGGDTERVSADAMAGGSMDRFFRFDV